MVIDTSALLGILFDEPGHGKTLDKLATTSHRAISHATLFEAAIVVIRRVGVDALTRLDRLVASLAIDAHPVDEEQSKLAREGFIIFGKGRHAAALNFGDCFTYALAKYLDEPVLCVGDDFARTDIAVA